MTQITVKEVNIETGEEFEREATTAEIAQMEADKAESNQERAALEESANAKTALLNRLGITADEAKLLLS